MLTYSPTHLCFPSSQNHEQNRPEFHGSLVRSHINGGEMVYFPEKEAQRLQLFSRSIVSTFVLVVAAVVAGIYLV
jgi:hypothetical protein